MQLPQVITQREREQINIQNKNILCTDKRHRNVINVILILLLLIIFIYLFIYLFVCLFIYLFIYYENRTQSTDKNKNKRKKTEANPYGSSLHAAQ